MKKIILFDPSMSSLNLGDEIIFESAFSQLKHMFPGAFFVRLSTHLPLSNRYLGYLKDADLRFVCGTNLLSSRMNARFRQWDIVIHNASLIGPVVLMGVGWWQYQNGINLYTKLLYSRIFSREFAHSVRDLYTAEKLGTLDRVRVLNTACPSLWKLDAEHCSAIPEGKGRRVIFTLTDYNTDPVHDLQLVETLCRNYDEVFFWIQGYQDCEYLKSLHVPYQIKKIDPELKAFDEILGDTVETDYVGTRLHAGIRALQRHRRSIIIGIDNRAQEMGKNFGLKVVDRRMVGTLYDVLNSNFKTVLCLPVNEIKKWKTQFE